MRATTVLQQSKTAPQPRELICGLSVCVSASCAHCEASCKQGDCSAVTTREAVSVRSNCIKPDGNTVYKLYSHLCKRCDWVDSSFIIEGENSGKNQLIHVLLLSVEHYSMHTHEHWRVCIPDFLGFQWNPWVMLPLSCRILPLASPHLSCYQLVDFSLRTVPL